MHHLIVSREFPPSAYPAGGIGTYVSHIARLLAERGEHVHVIGQLWEGAPKPRETQVDGRLTIHRVPLDGSPVASGRLAMPAARTVVRDFLAQDRHALAFAWQAALLAEDIVDEIPIDVIEGQDYESPLYFFQLRRALGLGPLRQPPCLVHLHSPLEFICRYNDWDVGRPEFLTTKRCEDHTIAAADGWVCPSTFLARQAEQHYGLGRGAVEHIPLPTGGTRPVYRTAETWQRGTICYFGRMEARKGVFEWLEAALSIAREQPDTRFAFIGADTPLDHPGGLSTRKALKARVPSDLRRRITFVDALPRAALGARLAQARIAVVPSRWENFPNTCIEAMGSGMPVIATRNGGMAEILEDGRSGWLAAACSSAELAVTLRRALATAPDALSAMGQHAVARVAEFCDNQRVVDQHLALRARIAREGAHRSRVLPDTLPFAIPLLLSGPRAGSGIVVRAATRAPAAAAGGAVSTVAAIVDAAADATSVETCVASLRAQTHPPSRIVVILQEPRNTPALADDVVQVVAGSGSTGERRARALDLLLATSAPDAVVTVEASCVLHHQALEQAALTLARASRSAVLLPWTDASGSHGVLAGPCPAFPYTWLECDAGPIAIWRTTALCDAGGFPRDFDANLDLWDALLGVMARGWAAATLPVVAGHDRRAHRAVSAAMGTAAHVRLWPWMLGRTTGLLESYAGDLAVLLSARAGPGATSSGRWNGADGPTLVAEVVARIRWRLATPFRLLRRALTSPRYTARWLAAHGKSIVRRPRETPEYSERGAA